MVACIVELRKKKVTLENIVDTSELKQCLYGDIHSVIQLKELISSENEKKMCHCITTNTHSSSNL